MYVIKGFSETKRNPLAEYTAFESAMHYGKHAIGIEILKLLKAKNEPIRTHYFWPLFVEAGRANGEKGTVFLFVIFVNILFCL